MRLSPIPNPTSCLLALAGCAVHVETTGHAGYDDALVAIEAGPLMEVVRQLAAPEMEGRLPGSPGYHRAAALAVSRFERAGLQPGYPEPRSDASGTRGEGWLLHFPMEGNDIERCDLSLPGQASLPLRLGRDFTCRGYTGSGDATSKVIFAGYGQSRPDLGYDDYAGLDAKGKIVLAFKQNPSWGPDGSPASVWGEATPRARARVAREHGAVALLLVPTPEVKDPQAPIGSLMDGPGEHVADLPLLQVSVETADHLLENVDLRSLWFEIEQRRQPSRGVEGRLARVQTLARFEPRRDNYDVVGVLPGTDPVLSQEALVLGAHLDHVGAQGAADGTRIIWPGANDNASGSAAVLALAEALARGPGPRRTVIFVLFSSEEHGLDGSRAYAANPPFPLERTVAMLNFDCIGIGDGLQLGGGKAWPKLWDLARELDRPFRRVVEDSWYGGGADAQPFFEAGIPTLYFATTNAYAHLHRVSDEPGTLAPDLYVDVVRLGWRVAQAIANGEYTREALQPDLAAGSGL
jgi:hypothetical protein